jgi:hypothetical protein
MKQPLPNLRKSVEGTFAENISHTGYPAGFEPWPPGRPLITKQGGNCICLNPQVRGRRHLLCWVPYEERSHFLAFSEGPSRLDVSLLSPED